MGINLLITLTSHKRRDVVAYSLGQLFVLIPEIHMQRLVFEELQCMENDEDEYVRRSALDSLEIISGEVNYAEPFNLIPEMFDEFQSMIKINLKYFKSHNTSIPYFKELKKVSNKITFFKPDIKLKERLIRFYNILNYSLYKNFLYSRIMKSFPELECLEYLFDDIFEEKLVENGADSYSKLLEFESVQKDALNELCTVYASSFLEKGHIRRLKSFLDDENYHVRLSGVKALSYVAKILISSNEKTFMKNLETSVSMELAHGKEMVSLEKSIA